MVNMVERSAESVCVCVCVCVRACVPVCVHMSVCACVHKNTYDICIIHDHV